jgi:cytochrome c oxidase subunit 2
MNISSRVLSLVSLLTLLLLAGCDGTQSMFRPAGAEPERVVFLFWVMIIGFSAIFVLVMLCLALAWKGPEHWRRRLRGENTVIGFGLVFPVVVLSVLLIWGFQLLGIAGLGGREPDLVIQVEGQQWWWRVTYLRADGTRVETANEIRVPVGALIAVELTSADVLHSFWIPAWAGKMDMIPGHNNILYFSVDLPGAVRGQCAEYCGGAHALMALYGVAMQPEEFARWLDHEAGPAEADPALPGREIFLRSGCGACHQVRGEAAPGGPGPDLTHLGGRLSIGAGMLANDATTLETWLARHPVLKPANLMPAFAFLSDSERRALAQYLEALQ